jgi:hypothetical protein
MLSSSAVLNSELSIEWDSKMASRHLRTQVSDLIIIFVSMSAMTHNSISICMVPHQLKSNRD